jgi:hypothetical protein
MNTVCTPCALALATIADRSPPLDRLTYQIQIPFPSNGPLAEMSGSLCGRVTVIGPAAFERRPRRPTTRIRPLRTQDGTVVRKPFDLRMRGNFRLLTLTFDLPRKSTRMPGFRFLPFKRRVPPVDTTCGCAPQTLAGQHLTELM